MGLHETKSRPANSGRDFVALNDAAKQELRVIILKSNEQSYFPLVIQSEAVRRAWNPPRNRKIVNPIRHSERSPGNLAKRKNIIYAATPRSFDFAIAPLKMT